MKIFYSKEDAIDSLEHKDQLFLNSRCPFHDYRVCGNWCALFYAEKQKGKVRFIILGCKGTDKKLYVD